MFPNPTLNQIRNILQLCRYQQSMLMPAKGHIKLELYPNAFVPFPLCISDSYRMNVMKSAMHPLYPCLPLFVHKRIAFRNIVTKWNIIMRTKQLFAKVVMRSSFTALYLNNVCKKVSEIINNVCSCCSCTWIACAYWQGHDCLKFSCSFRFLHT